MSDDQNKFEGFPDIEGNFTQVPNIAFKIMHQLSGAEYKCLMYIIRHTYGFDEPIKAITLDEFQDGRKRRDGSRMDAGTGLSKQAVVTALQSLLERGYLIVEKDDSDKARKERAYGVSRMSKNLTSDVKKLDIRGLKNGHRTEKYTSETNLSNTQLPVAPKNGATDTPPITDIYAAAAANPTSIDDFTTTADSLTNADTRRQPFEALKDEITAVWGWDNAGLITNVAKMLAGKFKDKDKASDYKLYQFDAKPVTADELEAWAVWVKRTYPKRDMVTTCESIAKSIGEYRAQKSTAVHNSAPTPVLPHADLHAELERRAAANAKTPMNGGETWEGL